MKGNGDYYILKTCPVHGLVQWAVCQGMEFCVPHLVQAAINTGEALKPAHDAGMEPLYARVKKMHLEAD